MDISAYQHMNIRMSTRGKRPLRNLTPSDKVRAIQRIHNGETKASVSRDIGVPESTLRGWCKNEQKLRFMCRQLGAADQFTPIPGIENPPEKRPRFDNHIHTPKYPANSTIDELGYNRLSLNGLSFPSNGSNAILEKIAFNEIMKKHMLSVESSSKQTVDNISAQMTGMVPLSGDYSPQLSMMQNLNLLAIDNTKSNIYGNINRNITASLSVKNWAKDPAKNCLLKSPNRNNSVFTKAINDDISKTNLINNDPNNNTVKEKNSTFPLVSTSDVKNYSSNIPTELICIPNISNTYDSECGNNIALLEWCKVFNASLNFLALAAALATLQPNSTITTANAIKKEDNILYNELTKSTNLFDSANNDTSLIGSDVSNDSNFDSEPEDLSVRSTATSKLSSPSISRSESPVKSNDTGSPLESDPEH